MILCLTFAGYGSFEISIAHASWKNWCAAVSPFRELILTLGVHLQLLVVFVIAWAWNLHWPSHQVHVNSLAATEISRWAHMEFGECRAFIFRDEAEAALILGCAQFISTRSREALGDVLKAWVFGSLGSQTVHQSLVKLLSCLQIILTGPWNDRINAQILLDVLPLEMLARETKGESSWLGRLSAKSCAKIVFGGRRRRHCCWVYQTLKSSSIPETSNSLRLGAG